MTNLKVEYGLVSVPDLELSKHCNGYSVPCYLYTSWPQLL